MKKLTDLSELAAAEAANLKENVKYLGSSRLLVNDVESVYAAFPPLIKLPGDILVSDEALTVQTICHEFLMCRLVLIKAVLATQRMYLGESLVHLRKAIESCAFAVRMSKHHNLSRVWAEAALDQNADGPKYGSAQEFVEVGILSCFSEGDEFGLGHGHSPSFQQQVMQVPVATAAAE